MLEPVITCGKVKQCHNTKQKPKIPYIFIYLPFQLHETHQNGL